MIPSALLYPTRAFELALRRKALMSRTAARKYGPVLELAVDVTTSFPMLTARRLG